MLGSRYQRATPHAFVSPFVSLDVCASEATTSSIALQASRFTTYSPGRKTAICGDQMIAVAFPCCPWTLVASSRMSYLWVRSEPSGRFFVLLSHSAKRTGV
jgi:hypothetical protein